MTDPVSKKEQTSAAGSLAAALVAAGLAAPAAPAAEPAPAAAPGERPARAPRGQELRRGGARRGADRGADRGVGARGAARSRPAQPTREAVAAPKAPARPRHPVLDQLAQLYPALFGEVAVPLKRGIFQDIQAAHPGLFEKDALKTALSIHTRASRYLSAVAAGQQRHDLQGQPVEAMAPEHIHHALLEVFRRRQQRSEESLRPKLVGRIVQAFQASGLSREDYDALVRGRDEAANAVLDEALAEAAARAAKDEALLKTFEASGLTVEAFAEMYGMNPRTVAQTLERTRQRLARA